jgi:hypothetical protein
MAVIRHFEANPEERAAYLKMRRLMAGVTEVETDEDEAAPMPRPEPGTLCRDVGGREPDPDHHAERVGQAVIEP